MKPTITQIDGAFAARVTDIDLTDMDDEAWQAVDEAFLKHGVLVFPGQNLDAEAQVAFANHFGDIELLRPDPNDKAVPITNVKEDGTVFEPKEHRFKSLRGNEGWHIDSTYMPLAAKGAVMTAQIVPEEDGETEWADMRAAYDDLDNDKRDFVEGLSAYHSLYQSQAKIGYSIKPGTAYGFHNKGAPLRPMVKTHPLTGRKALYVGRHAYKIPGMEDADALALVDELIEFACEPSRSYKHKWTPGDAIIWDNRCIMHRACSYDVSKPRVMRHVRIAGDRASELAPTGPDNLAETFEPATSNR